MGVAVWYTIRAVTMDARPIFLRLMALTAATFLVVGCGKGDGGGAGNPLHADGEVRIVSLSPALTRMVVDLGLGDLVVGRTRYCESIDPSIPVVGDHFATNAEAMVRVRPTHVLVQPPRNEVPPELQELAEKRGWRIGHWRINTVDDIRLVLRDLPDVLFFPTDRRGYEARQQADLLRRALDTALQPDDADQWHGRVLIVHSVEPMIGVFGEGTYLDEVLNRFGCTNAARGISGWSQLTLEDVVRLDPQAIVLTRPGVDQSDDPRQIAGPLATLSIEAVHAGRIAVLTGSDAIVPSTSLIDTARELRQIFVRFADAEP